MVNAEPIYCQPCGKYYPAPGGCTIDHPPAAPGEPEPKQTNDLARFKTGGSFILDSDPDPIPLWGDGHEVLWPQGESLIIVGPQGTGKSTLAQQLALGKAGFDEYAELLGYPILEGGRILYLAMDRPRQIARSFRRMVRDDQREELDDWLTVWEGPPLFDMAKDTGLLARMAEVVNARAIIVDSIKDAAIGLSDDDVGAGWNRARQNALAAGYELVELHHQRKAQQGSRQASTLDDVYGSTWITTGAGSVLMLTGSPGDPIVSAEHVKQPASEVGPLKLIHDHGTGRTAVWHAADLVAAARATTTGLSALDAARLLFEVDKPSAAQKEKARRKLERLAGEGVLYVLDAGDQRTKKARLWGAPS